MDYTERLCLKKKERKKRKRKAVSVYYLGCGCRSSGKLLAQQVLGEKNLLFKEKEINTKRNS
jgi:hypothetical protein